MPFFEDVNFALVNAADNTKKAYFDASNLTTNTESTIKLPATGASVAVTIAALEISQTFTDVQVFDDSATATAPVQISLGNTAANQYAATINDVTNANSGSVGIPVAGITGAREWLFPDASGTIALLAAVINAAAQTADIAASSTGAVPGAFYRVSYTLATSTADVTAGAVTVTFAYTDDAGATTTASMSLPLAALGRTTGSFVTYLASGQLTYATTHTGVFGSAAYTLRVRVDALG